VTTGRDARDEVPTRIERSLLASGAASDGARVSITVGEAPHRSTIVAYEADRAYGVRGSQALCIGAFSADTPSGAPAALPGQAPPSVARALSPPFTVDLAGNDLEPVPRAPRDVPPAGGSVSARLVAAATAERPQAAVLTYADGRTERVALDGG
jgi:hypothetical protein